MNKKIIALVIAALALFGINVVSNSNTVTSVIQGSEYHATTTRTYNGIAMTNLSVLQTGAGALGSVVITGAAAGVINIYDATSTQTNASWATTTLATIPASAAAGTYTFDVIFQKGLLIEIIGTTPTSTITSRP